MALCKDHVPATISFSYFSVSACDIKCFETEMVLLIDNLCEQHAILAITPKRPCADFHSKNGQLIVHWLLRNGKLVVIWLTVNS